MKTLKAFDKKWERRDAVCWLIVLSFNKPVQYDYMIPKPWYVQEMVQSIFAVHKYPEKFRQEILDNVEYQRSCDPYSDYDPSILDSFLLHRDDLFRCETLYRYGTWFAWRDSKDIASGQKAKEYEAKFGKRDLACMKRLQEHLRLKVEKIKEQETV